MTNRLEGFKLRLVKLTNGAPNISRLIVLFCE